MSGVVIGQAQLVSRKYDRYSDDDPIRSSELSQRMSGVVTKHDRYSDDDHLTWKVACAATSETHYSSQCILTSQSVMIWCGMIPEAERGTMATRVCVHPERKLSRWLKAALNPRTRFEWRGYKYWISWVSISHSSRFAASHQPWSSLQSTSLPPLRVCLLHTL